MQLEGAPKLYSAKAQRKKCKKPLSFVERFFNFFVKAEVRRMDGGGSSKSIKGICNTALKKDGQVRLHPFFSPVALL